MLIKFYTFLCILKSFLIEKKNGRFKEKVPLEGTQHTHISLFLMGEGGVFNLLYGISITHPKVVYTVILNHAKILRKYFCFYIVIKFKNLLFNRKF